MDDKEWTDIAETKKTGFETKIEYPADDANFLRVVALDKNGNVLGKSADIDLRWRSQAMNSLWSIARSPLKLSMIALCLFVLFKLNKRLHQFRGRLGRAFLGSKPRRKDSNASKYV